MAVTTSLFKRVTKFVPRELGNPRENRLTEVFASVLERVPGLGRSLVEIWLCPDETRDGHHERAPSSAAAAWERVRQMADDGVPLVATQLHVPGGFVDLELRFPGDTGVRRDDVVIWVEIKHGTEPHSGQVSTYLDALAARHTSFGGVGAMVLLDQRHKLPYTDQTEVPLSVAQRSWEQAGREVQRFAAPDDVSGWLCEQLLSYLQEENLMDPVALGPEHLTALAYAGQANKALEAICERAADHITRRFRTPTDTGPRKGYYGEGYWASWGDGVWLEWHLLRRGGHGPLEIRAGLCADKRREFDPEIERKLSQGIQIGGDLVVFERWQGPHERLMRVARPQDVLVGVDLDAQADSLARWVTATLAAVEVTTAKQI